MSDLFEHNLSGAATAQTRLGPRWYLRVYAWVVAGLLVPLLLVGTFNFVNDRYAVFRDDRAFMAESNLDIVRLKYLIQNGDDHRLILLGNSRASALDLHGRLSESAYTFPIAGGVLYNYLLTLRTLIHNDIVPETVILGLGEAAINPVTRAQREAQPWLYPRVEDLTLLDYLRDYLLFIPAERDFRIFRNRVGGYVRGIDPERSREMVETGRAYCTDCEARMLGRSEREHAAVLTETIRRWPRPVRPSQAVIDEGVSYAMQIIDQMQALADAHDIRLFIYVDAMYRERYLREDVPSLLRFKRELATRQAFLDFGNFDPAYTRPRDFLDPLHYDEDLGARLTDDIAAAMRGDYAQLRLGTWITPENVAAYTRQLEADYLRLQKQP